MILLDNYLVLIVGISKLLLLLCTGKESRDRARARFSLALVLKVDVALNTSAMKFQPRFTTFSSFLAFFETFSSPFEGELGKRFCRGCVRLFGGPYSVVVGGLVGGITNSISF